MAGKDIVPFVASETPSPQPWDYMEEYFTEALREEVRSVTMVPRVSPWSTPRSRGPRSARGRSADPYGRPSTARGRSASGFSWRSPSPRRTFIMEDLLEEPSEKKPRRKIELIVVRLFQDENAQDHD